LGSNLSIPTNARIIAATHRNLEQLVLEEKFRDDLYYRINVFKIALPLLAERKNDIPLLVEFFIERFNHRKGRSVTGTSREAMSALMLHDWPGNVRELENAIEYAFVLCRDEIIRMEDLPEHLIPAGDPAVPVATTLKEIERSAIVQALRQHQGKRMAVARQLGIDKNTLRRKMIRLGIANPKTIFNALLVVVHIKKDDRVRVISATLASSLPRLLFAWSLAEHQAQMEFLMVCPFDTSGS
jgi:DNA-binding NtrC family response regulator